MQNTIIVEGPDGAGKTTLIEQLFKDVPTIHNGVYPSPEAAYNVYCDQLDKCRNFESVVFDRSHISQAIYGPIYRNEPHLTDAHDWVDGVFQVRQAIVILCHTSRAIDNWLARRKQGGEYVQAETKFLKIYEAYKLSNITKYTKLPIVSYDYTTDSTDKIMERIELTRRSFYGNGGFV